MSFFASEKITTRYVCFFRCKLPRNFRGGNPLLLCTGGETGTNNCPKWKLYNFALKLEQLLENLKIVLPLVHSLHFQFQKNGSKSFETGAVILKLEQLLEYLKIVLPLLHSCFEFSILVPKNSSKSFNLKVPVFAKIG